MLLRLSLINFHFIIDAKGANKQIQREINFHALWRRRKDRGQM